MIEDTYLVIQSWMRTQLGLSGTELMCYAVIYGFSQSKQGVFRGGIAYLEEWLGATKPTVLKALQSLCDKGLITKTKCSTACEYAVTDIDKGKETLPERLKNFTSKVKNLYPEGKETLPNNKGNIDNINNNIVQSAPADVDDGVKKPTPKILTDEFAEVWKLYPRKEGKVNALKAYIKARQEGVDKDTIIAGVNAYVAHIRREHIEPSYIKMGSTWFHQRCWEDTYGITQSPQTAPTEQDEAIRRLLYERQQARKAADHEAAE